MEVPNTGDTVAWFCVQQLQCSHSRPCVGDIVEPADCRSRLMRESAAWQLAFASSLDCFGFIFRSTSKNAQTLQWPPGVQHIPIAAVRGRSIVVTAIVAATSVEVVDVFLRQTIDGHSQQ